MKFILCLCAACGLVVQPASAQVARYYNLFNLADTATNDLTAVLPASTTNQIVLLSGTVTNLSGSPSSITTITSSNIILNCHEFDKCGFTFQSVSAAGNTNGSYGVQVFGSASQGAVWDATARWSFTTTNTWPGQTYAVVTNLDLAGLDRIGFVFFNTETNGYQTNTIAGVRLKASKVMILPASD